MKEKLNKKINVGALSVRNTRKNFPNCVQKGEKGITLVALIITIIVLLILAVVAIRAVLNDGIISHAKNARAEYEKAQAEENSKLLQYEYEIAKSQGTFSGTYKDYLLNKEYNEKKENGTFEGTYDEYVASKYSLGEATNVENYGKKVVGYTSKGEGLDTLVWRIFYQDNKNVYLISETADKNYPISSLSFYTYNNELIKKDIVKKYNSGADVSSQGKALMPKASSLFTTSNTNYNIIATAYLCDTEVWDEYTDAEGKASFAIGSPTIELFEKSYNAYQKSISGTNEINTTVNSYGYTDGGTSDGWFTTDQGNGIYRLAANYVLLASPCSSGSMQMFQVNYNGGFSHLWVASSFPARPVVSIPVSEFQYTLSD